MNTTTTTAPSDNKPNPSQQLVDEQSRATKLNVLIAALEMCAEGALQQLQAPSVQPFRILLDQLAYQEFVHLPAKKCIGSSSSTTSNAATTILGIDNTPPSHQFSYTEKKALRSAIVEAASQRILQPAIAFMHQKRRQPAQFNVFAIRRTRQALLDAEQRRQQLQTELLAAQQRRGALLKRAAVHRVGGRVGEDMELQLKQLTLNSEKLSLLKAMVERELVYRTDHSAKALKEVDGYLDAALETYKK